MTRDVQALQEVLEAEHAMVYGYGVAGARLRGGARNRARAAWDRHRASRDALVAVIEGLGATPVPAAAAYELPTPVETVADAQALALLLEERLAAVWADAVPALERRLRRMAVEGLVEAATAAAGWRGSSVAFPGLAERSPE